MSNLQKALFFSENGSKKREQENFQGYVFANVNEKESGIETSFYRSDFRGAKFSECHFFKNNFSNADFIDSSINRTFFDNCQFKFTEIYNTYMDGVSFDKVLMDSASLVKVVCADCAFEKTKFVATTFRECTFNSCKIENCSFSKNSIDGVDFVKTSFSNVDLSNMTAINLTFSDCTFDNLIIDADYLGSYFFKGNLMDKIKLKYRGKIFDLNISQSDLLLNLFKIYFQAERYYEAINVLIQKNLLEKSFSSIFPLLRIVIDALVKEKNKLKRTYQIEKIFFLLEFYFNTGYVAITDYFMSIGYIDSLDFINSDFFEKLGYQEKLGRLKLILSEIDLSEAFLETLRANQKFVLEIKIERKDKKRFENLFELLVSKISSRLSFEGDAYEIKSIRPGSLNYEIVIIAGMGLALLKAIKLAIRGARGVMNEGFQLAIDYRLNLRALRYAQDVTSDAQLQKLVKVRKVQTQSQIKMSNENDEIITKEAAKLIPLMKSLKILPNALVNGDK